MSYQTVKGHERYLNVSENVLYYVKAWEDYILCDSNSTTFWKWQNCGDRSEIAGREDIKDEGAKLRGILAQLKYSAWYYNDEYTSLYICPSP